MNTITILSFHHQHHNTEILSQTFLEMHAQKRIYESFLSEKNILLLSTCYRNDILIFGSSERHNSLLKRVTKNIPEWKDHIQNAKIYTGADAITYFLQVSMGLKSTLIGETEITKQIQDSITFAQKYRKLSSEFCEFLKKIQELSKKFRKQFHFQKGSLSHAYLAFREAFSKYDKKSPILLCGFGNVHQKIIRYFQKKGDFPIVLLSKCKKEAAEKFLEKNAPQANREDYEQFEKYIKTAQMVFFATKSKEPLFQKKHLQILKQRKNPLYIFDLSVPADVSHEIRSCEKVIYTQVEDLDKIVQKNQKKKNEKKQEFLNFLFLNNQGQNFFRS